MTEECIAILQLDSTLVANFPFDAIMGKKCDVIILMITAALLVTILVMSHSFLIITYFVELTISDYFMLESQCVELI